MGDLAVFLEKLTLMGLEYFNVYLGSYRGTVTRNDDPQARGRVQARVPTVGHDLAPDVWIDPVFNAAGTNHGTFWPPEVGDSVRVKFELGNASYPVEYAGGWFGTNELPAEFAYSNDIPQRRGFITRAGHALIFSDEPGKEAVRLFWHKPVDGDESLADPLKTADRTQGDNAFVVMEADGSVNIANKNGSMVSIDATQQHILLVDENGNSVTMGTKGISVVNKAGNSVNITDSDVTVIASTNVHLVAPTVNIKAGGVFLGEAATQSVPLGELLLSWLNTHVHPTGTGPSGKAVIPASPTILSKSVKTR